MKKFVDDDRLIYKCCSLYYEDGWNQQRIANYLDVSRASISRMLRLGRERGIVKIEICSPGLLTYDQIERELERRLGIREVIVVDSAAYDTDDDKAEHIGDKAMGYLCQTLHDGDMVGVSMGTTLLNVVHAGRQVENPIECTFVPVLGGLSRGNTAFEVQVHANQLAVNFANIFGGHCIEFFAPAIFSNVKVLQGFMNEAPIRNILSYYCRLSMVIMGIGVTSSINSTLMLTEYTSAEEMQQLMDDGAVGDICLRIFDKDGNTEAFRSFNDRVAGISLDQLRQIEYRVGIVQGSAKAVSTIGAVKGGFVNVLIMDSDCAQSMLNLLDENRLIQENDREDRAK